MDDSFEDALLGLSYAPEDAFTQSNPAACPSFDVEVPICGSIFFPGAALAHYAHPLVQKTYDLLSYADVVQGITFIDCDLLAGPDGRSGFHAAEAQRTLAVRLLRCGVSEIVVASSDCFAYLEKLLSADAALSHIKLTTLPSVLLSLKHSIGADAICKELDACGMPHGSVPKASFCRPCAYSEAAGFASDLRALVDSACRLENPCEDGCDVQVCSCAHCACELSRTPGVKPVFHYLELLFGRRIDWSAD